MPSTFANGFDTERDAGLIVPDAVAQSNQVPTTPWSVIDAAAAQLNAGQPVTALPKQSWSVEEGQSFAARLNAFDQQAKAARAAAEQAAIDARMLEQMSRVAKSTKDIEIARRSIDVMALQRDIQNGVPIHQAVARHPMALGGGFGTALRATAPLAPVEPLSTTAEAIRDPSGNVLGFRASTGPRTGTIVQRAPAPGSISQEKRLTVDALRSQLRDVERAIADNALFSETASVKPKLEEWTKQRDELKRKLVDLVPGGYSVDTPKTIAVKGQGTKEDPARPENPEQFKTVPSKAYYIDPGDGKLYRKR